MADRNRLGTNNSLAYLARVRTELLGRARRSRHGACASVHERLGGDPDADLLFFVAAHVFVPAMKSSFSLLALKCREHRHRELNPRLGQIRDGVYWGGPYRSSSR